VWSDSHPSYSSAYYYYYYYYSDDDDDDDSRWIHSFPLDVW